MHYSKITSYRVLEPRMRIVYSEDHSQRPTERYLQALDQSLYQAQAKMGYGNANDLISLVFANQAAAHEVSSRQSAELIGERRTMAERHLADIQLRLYESLQRRPLRRPYGFPDRQEQDLEKQILDLEKQGRDVQVALWRDILELRTTLVTERRDYMATQRRISFLSGGSYGAD